MSTVGARVVLSTGRSGRATWSFAPGRTIEGVVLGAAPDCDWSLAAAGVAPRHARLAYDGARLWVSALDAGAPVHVDGTPLGEDWTALDVGSVLALGAASLRVAPLEAGAAPSDRDATHTQRAPLPASLEAVASFDDATQKKHAQPPDAAASFDDATLRKRGAPPDAAPFAPPDDDASFTLEASLPGLAGSVEGAETRVELPAALGATLGTAAQAVDGEPTETARHAPWSAGSEDDTLIQASSAGRVSPLGPHAAFGGARSATAPANPAQTLVVAVPFVASRGLAWGDGDAGVAAAQTPSGVLSPGASDAVAGSASNTAEASPIAPSASWLRAHPGLALRLVGGLAALALGVVLAVLFADRGGTAPPRPAPSSTSPSSSASALPLPLPSLAPPIVAPAGLAPIVPQPSVSPALPGAAPSEAVAPSASAQAVALVAEGRFAEAALAYESLARAEPGRPELALVARVLRARVGGAAR
jgi:hypothetical protein